MMLYNNTEAMVRSLNGDPDFFDCVAGVLAPYLFIICQITYFEHQ